MKAYCGQARQAYAPLPRGGFQRRLTSAATVKVVAAALMGVSGWAQSNWMICPPGYALVKVPNQVVLAREARFELEFVCVPVSTNPLAPSVLASTNEVSFGDKALLVYRDAIYDGASTGLVQPIELNTAQVRLTNGTITTHLQADPTYLNITNDPVNLASVDPPDPLPGTNANTRARAAASVQQAVLGCLTKAVSFTSPEFLDQLGVSDQVKQWYAQGYRSNLTGLTRFDKPLVSFEEVGSPSWMAVLQNDNEFMITFRSGADTGFANYPPLSQGYDCGVTLGDYAGLVVGWLIPCESGFPAVADSNWQQNNLPGLNDSVSLWVAHLHDDTSEVYKYASYAVRQAGGRPCSTITNNVFWNGLTYPGGFPDCLKGENLRNVMMHDEAVTTRSGIYPFSTPIQLPQYDGPVAWNHAALFFAGIYYDISQEAGLGDAKVNLLVWKTVSVITNCATFTMRDFSTYLLRAAGALWPDAGHPGQSYYDAEIKDVLRSRGVPLASETTFRDNLPPALQPVRVTAASGFGSVHPETHVNSSSYGAASYSENSYTHSDAATNDYMVYQFYKHSKYGPCDLLKITDGTFTTPDYNGDGSYYYELKDRELQNLLLMVPGPTIDWVRYKKRCATEHEGFYAEDVRPFGFRVIQAIKNGFVWKTTRLSASGGTITYQFEIVDPSQATLGPATYEWTFTDYLGGQNHQSGPSAIYAASQDEPLGIIVSRVRGAETNTITLSEPGSNLDRADRPHWLVGLRTPESSVSAADRGHYFNLEPTPRFTGWQMLGDGSFDLVLSGASNTVYHVYASTNLLGWEDLGAATQTVAGVYHFVDGGAATNGQRFYQARKP